MRRSDDDDYQDWWCFNEDAQAAVDDGDIESDDNDGDIGDIDGTNIESDDNDENSHQASGGDHTT